MEKIVAHSAYITRNILSLELEGETKRAYDLKVQWAVWRDSLSTADRERCVWAYVAAQTSISEGAMELLKEQKPDIYKIYKEVRGE